ncbi:restriction endonuclease subunit S [Acinetobacter soli]|uniref:restriction endonuclease subunit S n=1 Tax=Acinetobacter soli TaxID=487316 RepID=UPI00280E1C40|nr:restriction endonuclease subunit S [Acinetobacter soli]MDQ8995933.1 restriction endonuclease subunit S [Acinetobacter soli]
MTKYQKYAEYKDSGVEALGLIPKGWSILRGKFLFKEINERSESGEETLLSVSEYYGVKPREEKIADGDFLTRAESLEGYKKCYPNDLVMNIMLAWKRGLGVSKYEGIVSPAYSVFRFSEQVNSDYIHYLLRTEEYTKYFKTRSTGIIDSRLRLYPESFGDIFILFPTLEIQTQIANFLDYETAKIDTLIAKQEELIALLKEKRQAVISHAVTKGLNPNVPMKDSGVEWLGQVPEHWEVKQLRYLGSCQNGINIGAEYFGSGSPFISYGDVYRNHELPTSFEGLVQSTENDRRIYSLQRGDVLFTRTSETIEEIGFSSTCLSDVNDATFAGFLIRFRPIPNTLLPEYSKFYFRNILLRAFFVKEMNLVTRASLSQELLKKLAVPFPNLEEQKQIADFLSAKERVFKKLINDCIKQIELLKERRTALISAAVTGKIDVRNWQNSNQKNEVNAELCA